MVIEKGLYSYPMGSGHCKHGMVVTFLDEEGEMSARDTYWSSGGAIYKFKDIKDDVTFLLDLKNTKEVSKEDYKLYDESDRAYIPVGGWHEKYLVRADAEKRKDYIIANLELQIEENKSKIRSLEFDNKCLEEKLKQYR